LKFHQGILIFVQPDDSTPRLALPQVLTEEVIQAFHEQYGHFGVSKVYSMVRRYFFFPNMRRRIERLVKSCDLCQKTKYPNRGLCGEMNAIIAGHPGDLVTVDYYGPLPPSRSRVSYILVVIDSFSKFVKLYPLRRAQARISVRRVVEDFHRVVPIKVILSDHGTQFQSRLWQDTLRQWGITPTMSSIRHPQSNPTERVMKELGRLFRAYCHNAHANWASVLSSIELLFNTTTHSSTGFSPYEVIFGRNPTNPLSRLIEPLLPAVDPKPLEQIREEARANLRRTAEQRRNSRRGSYDTFQVGDLVLLRVNPVSDAAGRVFAKFCLLYSGPYLISERPYSNVYTLSDPTTGSVKGKYNIVNLKLYFRRA
jgi:transposase InsO family protein